VLGRRPTSGSVLTGGAANCPPTHLRSCKTLTCAGRLQPTHPVTLPSPRSQTPRPRFSQRADSSPSAGIWKPRRRALPLPPQVPVSPCPSPDHPGGQRHLYSLSVSRSQVPPLRQGLLRQALSRGVRQSSSLKPRRQAQA